jgi:N-acetylglucosamine-6-phosphate deacetylase
MRLGVARAVSEGTIVDGDVEVEDGRVSAVGVTPAGRSGTAIPGFVDLQVNGFAGIDFAAATPKDYTEAGAALVATGVVAYQPTLITLPEEQTVGALAALAAVPPDDLGPRIIGMHLEGPFLSPLRAGAHDAAAIIDPDPAVLERLLDAGPVTMVTVAPERPGALELIDLLIAEGIAVACGHSDATAAEAHAAFDRGATTVTHLFNAQRPFGHREPGIAGAALSRGDVTVSIIVDGFHLADEVVRLAFAAPASVAIITDAIAAAGQPDGTYPLGNRTVTVDAGSARLDDGTLAGSVLTMDAAVRNLVDLGVSLPDAVAAATAVPARAVQRPDMGRLAVGTTADVAIISNDLFVERTLIAGAEVFPPG